MKKSIFKSALLTAITATVFTSCVNGDDYGVPNLECVESGLAKTKEVSEIPFGNTIAQYTDEDIIEAFVTSSDRDGNFFKTISMQTLDGSNAFSVSVDVTGTFINYEPGRKVLINLKDLYYQNNTSGSGSGGKLLGALNLDNGDISVGRMPEYQYLTTLNRGCTVVSEEELVQETSLINLSNDSYLNKLVEISDVQFTDDALGTNYYDSNNDLGGATNHMVTDKFGNEIIFRTSSYATFANKSVSNGSGKIRGVLTKYGTDYQLVARYESDIMLNEDRFMLIPAFYVEDFQTSTNNTNLNITGWTNFAEEGTWVWREKVYNSNGYAEFSAFGGQVSNVAWLITPAIDFTGYTQKVVSFEVAQHHLDVDAIGNSLEILVSTDYDGTNVLTATWQPISANIPTMDTSWYEFLSSTIDISNFSGNTIYVAFKFRGSGTDLSLDGAFQVDNFKAFGQ